MKIDLRKTKKEPLVRLESYLKSKGINVCGTISQFYGHEACEGLWISAEDTPNYFNYYNENWLDTFGVNPKLSAWAERKGYYFEWNDAGTIFIFEG